MTWDVEHAICKVKGYTENCMVTGISIAEHSNALFSGPCVRLTQLEEGRFSDSSPFEIFSDHLHWLIIAHRRLLVYIGCLS